MKYTDTQNALLDQAFRESDRGAKLPVFFAGNATRTERQASFVFGLLAVFSVAGAGLAIIDLITIKSDETVVGGAGIFAVAGFVLSAINIALYTFICLALRSEKTLLRRIALVLAAIVTLVSLLGMSLVSLVAMFFLVWTFPYSWWDRSTVARQIREENPPSEEELAKTRKRRKHNVITLSVGGVIVLLILGWGYSMLRPTEQPSVEEPVGKPTAVYTGYMPYYLAEVRENAPATWTAKFDDEQLGALGLDICNQMIVSEVYTGYSIPPWMVGMDMSDVTPEEEMDALRVTENAAGLFLCPA